MNHPVTPDHLSFLSNPIRSTHLLIAAGLAGIVVLVSMCDPGRNENNLSGIVHVRGQEFAGSETCMQCHPAVAASHMLTPHFLTSGPAGQETVKGSFDSGRNVLVFTERLKVVMEKTATGLFQQGIVDSTGTGRKPFDITIGSGRQGQTYLYWHENSLFQLPVSYYTTEDTWSNSPGYPRDQIVFDRNIPARCMECHSTYFRTTRSVGQLETFDKNQVILGVDCERCHGPAGDHVTFHRENPEENSSRYVANPAHLSRQQRLDNCALCHSGIRENLMPSFTFLVGDKLEDFSFPAYGADSAATLDVHGNQYGLLTSSKCFRMSDMDCSSCHNVHVKETRNLELFSARCMNCHQKGSDNFCTQPEVPGLTLSTNCIDCHMPRLPSRQVFVQASGNVRPTPFFVRTHLVGKYKEQVEAFLEKIEME